MELHEWLDKPENKGRASWLADAVGRSKTAVSLWRDEGVPLPLIPQIATLTGGEVCEASMLRHAMRCRVAKARGETIPKEPAHEQ